MRTNLIKTKELPKVVEPSTTDGMLDMVIASDTTGSMSAYINAVKTHVKELVPKLFSSNPDLRIGIVAFGDYCDMKAPTLYGKAYKEDKKDGTPGIRTIFEGIKSSEVFTVVFQKQDKAKTKKQYEAEREAQRQEAVALIDKAKKAKKSMAEAYKLALEHIQNNPIKDFIEGEDRVLRVYKMQFVSRDGKYKCMDMDVVRGPKETGERLVNINTIKQLIFNGVKYVVE